jgi:hypothetical protein
MGQCAHYGCEEHVKSKFLYCPDHNPKKKVTKSDRKAKAKQIKADAQQAAKELRRVEQLERQNLLAEKATAKRLKDIERTHFISNCVQDWNAEINVVAQKVKKLRRDNPKIEGINAGKNNGCEDVLGGTDNPIKLVLPANGHNVAIGDVLPRLNGYEPSDSGVFKLRITHKGNSDIFIHAW